MRGLFRIENGVAGIILLLIAVLPTMEIIARLFFKTGIHSSADLTHHLVLWLTCLGGAITSREGKHITLSAGLEMISERVRSWIIVITTFISTTISSAMTWSALSLVLIGFDPTKKIAFIPIQLAVAVIPLGFLLITVRFMTRSPVRGAKRGIAVLGCILGTIISFSSVMNILYTLLPEVPVVFSKLEEVLFRIA